MISSFEPYRFQLIQPNSLIIPSNLHRGRERPNATPVLRHIHVEPAWSRHLLQLALRTGHPPEALLPEQRPEELRQRNLADIPAETRMRANAVVDVCVQRPPRVDRLRLREDAGVFGRGYEGHKDPVTWLYRHRPAVVFLDGVGDRGFAVETECAGHTDAFHGIAHSGRGQNLTPHDVIRAQSSLLQALGHVLPLDVHLDNLAQRLRNLPRALSQRKRLGRINVEEDAHKDNRQDLVELLLGENTLGILFRLERQVEHARYEMRVRNVTHVTDDIDLRLPRKLVRLALDQLLRRRRVERLDRVAPGVIVQQSAHALPLLRVQLRVAREHEAPAALAHEVLEALLPADAVLSLVLEDVLGRSVADDVDARGCRCGTAKVEAVYTLDVREDLVVLCGYDHWVVRVDRVALEVLRESAQEELVEYAAMVDIEIIVNLLVAPVRQVTRVVIGGVVPITTDESNGIRENDSGDGVRRSDAHTRRHGRLGLLCDDTGIQLNEVRMLVEVFQRLGDLGIRVDLLESIVGLETEMLTELIETSEIPLAATQDTQHLDRLHDTRDVTSTKSTARLFNRRSKRLDKLIIVELAIGASLETTESSLGGLISDRCLKGLESPHHSLQVHRPVVLAEELGVEILDPFLVHLRETRSPRSVNAVKIDDVAYVINQRDVDVQTRSDKTRCLKQLCIALLPRRLCRLRIKILSRLGEATAFVDVGQVGRDMIVETVEHDEKNGYTRGVADETLVSEAIGLELAVLECSDGVAGFLGRSVQRSEV
ncbi:hypothetical protein HG530_011914 [Fusarium avenaceum]|nr:hypothetical protein HG530_011914 [Fusarium avenaceum]